MSVIRKFDNTLVGLTVKELAVLKKLKTPRAIQDFISAIPQNFELNGDSCLSVRSVLSLRHAHCIEGALVAALALWVHGEPPLLLDLGASHDDDHVVALFKRGSFWGAISKGNHAPLRYRDPVYRTLRELALSYFHEYSNAAGMKTLRSYSRPLNLSHYDPSVWITGESAWHIAGELSRIRHFQLITPEQVKFLRPLDQTERNAGRITEWKK